MVVPRTVDDVVATVQIAAEEKVPSCRAGRPPASRARRSAPAIIIDFSKYLNRIGIVDRDPMTVGSSRGRARPARTPT